MDQAAQAKCTHAPELFFSYCHKDEALRDKLAAHLKLLERQGIINTWHDRNIDAGSEWKQQIDSHLESAKIILLLISAAFLASDYCFDIEMKAAMDRHKDGSAVVIAVILRPVDWEKSPFSILQALPKDAKPITTYSNRDLAFEEVAKGIRKAAEGLSQTSTGTAPNDPAPLPGVAHAFLPVTPASPLLLGFAIDVSGSMQESIGKANGPALNRLQSVLATIQELAGASEISARAKGALELVKVFAYGFGFTDRAADYGSFAGLARQFLGSAIPDMPAHVYRGSIRDLFEIAGLGTDALLLSALRARWKDLESGLWEQRVDLFGDTPMRAALEASRARLAQEYKKYAGTPRSILIIISDGDSTDGSPLDLCQAIMEEGITIVTGYLTSADVTEPRKLYSEADPGWPAGAKTLFGCSSQVREEASALRSVALASFESKGWQVSPGSRLFLQLNQSEILSEFLTTVLDANTAKIVASNS
ncbi:MAG: TIR domain-containing protein [Candidatus Korobacteraceae bacterium]|jgi:TIR domain-containing protein